MSTQFAVGDSVIDTKGEDTPELIVIDPDRGIAGEVVVAERDATVAELNEGVSPTEPVVECLHVDWLNRHVGSAWETWQRESFNESLDAYTREWRLTPKFYDYPVSRLRPVSSDAATDTTQSTGQSSMTDWVQ